MDPIIFAVAFITFISTIVGGLAAIRYRSMLQYFFAFAAGSLIAVTFFDILPESLSIAASSGIAVRNLFAVSVGVFFVYSLIERFFLTHHFHDDNEHGHIMGPLGAGGLVIHSFFDGIAIGTAYQVSSGLGLLVALAVIFHDFNDGINTVTLMLKNKHQVRHAKLFLFADAIAPVFGVLIASIFFMQQAVLAFILAAFAGEFIYIGAANLLPETYKHTPWKMALSMLCGIVLIFVVTSFL
jgi:ZIP family zinc transporter